MTIASEITRINNNIAAAYTACNNKGATMPVTQNSANLATCIGSITGGGGSSTKYGVSMDSILGDVDANGVLQQPSVSGSLVFTGVQDIAVDAMYYRFYSNPTITSVSFPDLTTISGSSGLSYAFSYCPTLASVNLSSLTTVSGLNGLSQSFRNTALTSVNLSSLTTISGNSGLSSAFSNCASLASVDLSSLTTISGSNGLSSAFQSTALTSVNLSSLTTVSGSTAMNGTFYSCKNLSTLSFPALTTTSFGSYTNQFSNMFNSSTGSTSSTSGLTVHFPSNLQATIQGLDGYPTFGGSASLITLAFDLTATS